MAKNRDQDFYGADETIPTSVLANRLHLLVDSRLVEKRSYQDNPPR